MGIVHLASDTHGNPVVVKEPLLTGSNVDYNVDKLKVEADILQHLTYPSGSRHIVRYMDRVTQGNILNLVVEYVDGDGMYNSCMNKMMDCDAVKDYGLQLLDAVVHMHDRSVIHRDLNPRNIITKQNGQIKLIDFGTAKYCYTQIRAGAQGTVGTVIYTPGGWTAPEQYSGMATFQSDIYSVGAILYFLLTGRPPSFCVTSRGKIKRPSSINPKAKQLSNLVMKALKENSNTRYQTALDMKNYLSGAISVTPSSAHLIYGNKKYPISGEVLLGRADFCDVKIPDTDPNGPFISSRHAKVYEKGGRYWIEDQKSTNGTFIFYQDQQGRILYHRLTPYKAWALQDDDLVVLCYDQTLGPYVTFKFKEPK